MKVDGRNLGHDTEAPATTKEISATTKSPDRSYRTPSGNGGQKVIPGVPHVGIYDGSIPSSQARAVEIPAQRSCRRGARRPVRPTLSPTGERICALVRQWVIRGEWVEPTPSWPRTRDGWPIPPGPDGLPDWEWTP